MVNFDRLLDCVKKIYLEFKLEIDVIIHLAGYKAVGESIQKPIKAESAYTVKDLLDICSKLGIELNNNETNKRKTKKELYESIQRSKVGVKKSIVKESLGFASKAAGVAPKKAIVESNDVITRMQKLANIIK